MSEMVNVNIKMDSSVKKAMEEVCEQLGLSLSAAFIIYARKVGREKRIPFEVSIDPFYDPSNNWYFEKEYEDYKNGKMKNAEHSLNED